MTDDPIDLAVFNALQESTGAEFVDELVMAFLGEAPGILADLTQAAKEQDADGFRRAAHSLKSNAHIFGAQSLANVARDMELDGVPHTQTAQDAKLALLDTEYARAARALRDLTDG